MYHVPSRIVMRLMHQHTMQEELETRTKRKNCERDTYNHSKRQKICRCSSESDEEDIDEKVVENRRIQVITQESSNLLDNGKRMMRMMVYKAVTASEIMIKVV